MRIPGADGKQWIMRSIIDEVCEEINDRADDDKDGADALLSEWFSKCALMLEWVATGDIPAEAQEDPFINEFLLNRSETQLALESHA